MIRKVVIIVLTTLAFATATLWTASYTRWSNRYWQIKLEGKKYATAWASDGELIIRRVYSDPQWSTTWSERTFLGVTIQYSVSGIGESGIGAMIQMFQVRSGMGQRVRLTVSIPLWMPLCLFAPYPILALVRGPLRRRVRRKQNCCVRCGYDLTGNVSGVCSECGKNVDVGDRNE